MTLSEKNSSDDQAAEAAYYAERERADHAATVVEELARRLLRAGDNPTIFPGWLREQVAVAVPSLRKRMAR